MASAKQIAWRKKFAKMAKSGKFKKKKKITTAEYDKSGRMVSFGNPRKRMANPHNDKTEKKGHISKFLYQSLVKDLQRNTKKLNDVRDDPRVNYYGGYKQKQEHIAYLQNVVAENKKIIQANHP
jgi:pyruvate carboxylase